VLVDGELARSCITPLAAVAGRRVLTIEGLATGGELHPLQRAFLDAGAFQCGYCTPGMIMAGVGLLSQHPDPDEDAIIRYMQGNICRCGMYARIVRAIRQAAAELRSATPAGGG
jgi:aerobic-type carbon monoxide dehydrogenase small subunit (CoxS/CutS family)